MPEETLSLGQQQRAKIRKELRVLPIERTSNEEFLFLVKNALLLPLVLIAYMTVNAEGFRTSMPFMAIKLYKAPIPGAGLLQQFDGWNRLDYAHLTAIVLLIGLHGTWCWIVAQVAGNGDSLYEQIYRPWFYRLRIAVATVLISFEIVISWIALCQFSAGLWSGSTVIVATFASVLYVAGMMTIACWHNSFKYGG